jgi:hypothetical protein
VLTDCLVLVAALLAVHCGLERSGWQIDLNWRVLLVIFSGASILAALSIWEAIVQFRQVSSAASPDPDLADQKWSGSFLFRWRTAVGRNLKRMVAP